MFTIKPVEIDSRNRVFISSAPHEPEDFDLIARKRIKKVIFLGGFERSFEKSEFERRGIEFFQPDSYEAVFLSVNKNCLIHCAAGKGAQIFGMCYLIRNGLPIEKAIDIVQREIEKIGITPTRILQADRQLFEKVEAGQQFLSAREILSAHKQELVISKPGVWQRMKNWALKRRQRVDVPEKLKKICSQCGSESLKPAIVPWRAYATAFGQYKCLECGFEGIAVLADEKSAEKIRKKLKAKLGINKK